MLEAFSLLGRRGAELDRKPPSALDRFLRGSSIH
jgi:hypothetical protein